MTNFPFIYSALIYFHFLCVCAMFLDPQSSHDVTDSSTTSPKTKRLRSSQDFSSPFDDSISRMYQSQPVPTVIQTTNVEEAIEGRNGFCFSQPAMLDDLLLCTQLNSTQGAASQNPFQKLVKRMTRFFVTTKCDQTISRLSAANEKLGYTWKANDEGIVSFVFVYCYNFFL